MKCIYLDVCAMCRPFDDQSFMRIRFETDAVIMIEESVRKGRYSLIVSPAHFLEIGAVAQQDEGAQLVAFLKTFGKHGSWDFNKARKRAEELYYLNFGLADAAHVAFAEQSAQIFITCDDLLLKRCRKAKIFLPAMCPVEFCISEGLQ